MLVFKEAKGKRKYNVIALNGVIIFADKDFDIAKQVFDELEVCHDRYGSRLFIKDKLEQLKEEIKTWR